MLKILKDSKWCYQNEQLCFKKGEIVNEDNIPFAIRTDLINHGYAEIVEKKTIKKTIGKIVKDIEDKTIKVREVKKGKKKKKK